MRKCLSILLASALILITLASCHDEITPATESDPSASSTASTIASTLLPAPTKVKKPSGGLRRELKELWNRIDGSTATIPLTTALYNAIDGGDNPPEHNTTPEAYNNLIKKNDIDLIFVTHPSVEELRNAESARVALEVIPVAKDALVFLVNSANPVDDVSMQQLRDVYRGKTTNWRALGGYDDSIIAYQRTENSGSQTLFMKLLMDGRQVMRSPSDWYVSSMSGLVESLSYYDNSKSALGYSMFYYVNNMYGNSRFKLLSIDGVKPTRDTIAQGEYALEDYYYAVMREDTPINSPARKLVDWLLTDAGQVLAAKAGYIPLRSWNDISGDNPVDPIYSGNTIGSSGTGGTVMKPGTSDINPRNGIRTPLSDLFLDGFDYIQYINNSIAEQIDDAGDRWVWAEDLSRWATFGEFQMIRPFTGIPDDYPHYTVLAYDSGPVLRISFPEGNPFFNEGIDFDIRLSNEISPYGKELSGFSYVYRNQKSILPRVEIVGVVVEFKGEPIISNRINEGLKAWFDDFSVDEKGEEMLANFYRWVREEDPYGGYWPDLRILPHVTLWRDYLSVSYIPQTSVWNYEVNPYMPMISTICFDVKTGRDVHLAYILRSEVDISRSSGFKPLDFRNPEKHIGKDYDRISASSSHPSKSRITHAWVVNDAVWIYLKEPNGSVWQIDCWYIK